MRFAYSREPGGTDGSGGVLAERRTPLAPDRRLALSVLLSVLIMCVIGVYYAGDTGPGALDARVRSAIDCRLGNHTGLLRDLVLPTSPYLLVPAIAVIVVVCLILGRRRDAA